MSDPFPRAPIIGLFGTCGHSQWRKPFIDVYDAEGIRFYNPQKDDWKPEYAIEENQHLLEDEIILFPVTDETTAVGSLGEIGFSILEAVRNLKTDRYVVVLIDDDCKDPKADAKGIKDSRNARVLVKSKIRDNNYAYRNVFLVETLDQMLDLSLKLHRHLLHMVEIRRSIRP